jgi:hypothetical protein
LFTEASADMGNHCPWKCDFGFPKPTAPQSKTNQLPAVIHTTSRPDIFRVCLLQLQKLLTDFNEILYSGVLLNFVETCKF